MFVPVGLMFSLLQLAALFGYFSQYHVALGGVLALHVAAQVRELSVVGSP